MISPSLAALAVVLQLASCAPSSIVKRGSSDPVRPAKTYAECQRQTHDPLSGCPPGTLYVSKSGHKAAFGTIQDAIASLPHDDSEHVILIAPGNYTEQLNVTRPGSLTLLGVSNDPSRGIPYGSGAHSDSDRLNGVQILWAAANNDSTGKITDNAVTTVLTVAPTFNASLTGSGPTGFPVPSETPFGNADFRAYNIDFRNVYSLQAAGPALAVNVAYANAGFYGCGFYSYQDTVYIGKLGNAFFYDNVIAGETDFLYGFGTAWVEKSTLALRNCGGGITAWKGTNTTFTNKYGIYISTSRVIAANSTVAVTIKGTCALGRPWNALHRSIFIDSYLDTSILPAGYILWSSTDPRFDNTTTMAVYNDKGPGYNETAIAASNISLVLDAHEVEPYSSPHHVFIGPNGEPGNDGWIDDNVYHKGIHPLTAK